MNALNGQVAIVTGAGTGIGRATALALAAEGAAVVLTGRRLEPLEETASAMQSTSPEAPSAIVVQADVTEPDDVARFTEIAHSISGYVDILVNNAGLNVPTARHCQHQLGRLAKDHPCQPEWLLPLRTGSPARHADTRTRDAGACWLWFRAQSQSHGGRGVFGIQGRAPGAQQHNQRRRAEAWDSQLRDHPR